jgi:uncharacterized protein YndB with AHSA1/START domain
MSHAVTLTQTTAVPPSAVYKALTTPTLLRHWLCDSASIESGGNFLFNWDDGRAVSGCYVTRDPERVVWTWAANGGVGAVIVVSQVAWALTAADGGTRIDLEHSGIAPADAESLTEFWTEALGHLQMGLETGDNTREARRPMLGIFPSELEAERAARLGIPTARGVYIDNVIAGKSAEAAGIRAGDVIISIDQRPVWNFSTLTSALRRHSAGNHVTIELYRGADKLSVMAALSGREQPPPPTTIPALVAFLETKRAELDAELDAITRDIPEDGMEHVPSEGEWSANETLAHLIFTERWLQIYVWGAVAGDDSLGWIDNNPAQRAGIMAAHPTGDELVTTFKRAMIETIGVAAALPPAFVALRPAFARAAETLTTMHDHTREHYAQMQAAIQHWAATAVSAG